MMNKNTNKKSRKITLSTQTLRRLDGARKEGRGDGAKRELASKSWFLCNLTKGCDIGSYAIICA